MSSMRLSGDDGALFHVVTDSYGARSDPTCRDRAPDVLPVRARMKGSEIIEQTAVAQRRQSGVVPSQHEVVKNEFPSSHLKIHHFPRRALGRNGPALLYPSRTEYSRPAPARMGTGTRCPRSTS